MSTGTEPVVEAKGIVKHFDDVTAVAGVDLVVHPGQVHGMVGPNGAGKTTLLAMLLGLVRPDAGTVRLFGRTREEAGSRAL
ncbi:MAG TPA: ATP-binding cassette domain-containing protein, partial [Actinopolymorphaceae bacterium]|nr:ATP-binding cassette domain-containing protein [Actinopolymorphaceae bacterium]